MLLLSSLQHCLLKTALYNISKDYSLSSYNARNYFSTPTEAEERYIIYGRPLKRKKLANLISNSNLDSPLTVTLE